MKKDFLSLKLLELRQEHNLTQKELCEKLNISRANYSYFENGRRIPDLETLLLIAGYYNVSLNELVTDSVSANDAPTFNHNTDLSLTRHFKAKHIPIEDVLTLSKSDFDFLMLYKKLSSDNQAELTYLANYKLKKQQ